jgi:hypothetical protein
VDELVFGARFVMMYEPDKNKQHTILDHNRLHTLEPAELPGS